MHEGAPLAYWVGDADWRAVAIVLTSICTVLGAAFPFFRAWQQKKLVALTSSTLKAEQNQERLDRIAREQYNNVTTERDYAVARLAWFQAECERLTEDRNRGWNLGRAMEECAQGIRHAHADTVADFNTLLAQFHRFVEGSMDRDQARFVLDATQPLSEPPRVPPLRSLNGMKPP